MSEPMRIDGMAGYETRIDATSGKDNTAVTVVQWLRFGGPNALRIIGSAPRDEWTESISTLPRRARRHSAARITQRPSRQT